jgi:hypothetical protein
VSNRINHIAVLVAAIVYFLFGWLWYTLLFSHQWAEFVGKPTMATPPPSLLVESFLLGLILSYATAIALSRRPEDLNVGQGVSFAMFMGLAIYGSQTLNNSLYEGRPIGLWLLNTGYVVIGFAIIGAIIGGWRQARA